MRTVRARALPGALLLSLLGACDEAPPRVEVGPWDLVTVGPAHTDPEAAARRLGDVLEIAPGARATFHLELPGGGVLRLAGRSASTGNVLLRTRLLNPHGGAIRSARISDKTVEVAGPFDGTARLPDPGGDVLVLDLEWIGATRALFLESMEIRPRQKLERPSVVFVSIDTLAARHLSLYGYPRKTTPNLERFAEDATVFEHCDANAAWTTPSYMSQFTGQLASAFESQLPEEVFGDLVWNHFYLPEGHWTLAEMLRAAGYETAAFVDNLKIGEHLGLSQGFDVYDTSASEISHKAAGGGIDHVVEGGLEWLDSRTDGRPVFLLLQGMDVHGPYRPEPPWQGRFTGDEHAIEGESIVSSLKNGVWGQIPGYVSVPFHPPGEPPETLPTELVAAAYDEEILAVDAAFGRLLEALEDRGLDDAVIVFSADHGEAMLEHDSYFSHHTVYQETLHVPLVVRFPGKLARGERIAERVQLVDLYPTLAQLAGLRTDREHLHGRSLLPLVRGKAPKPESVVHATGGMFAAESVTSEGWKLVEMRPNLRSGVESFLSWPRARARLEERYPDLEGLVAGMQPRERFVSALEAHGLTLHQAAREILKELERSIHELYYLPDDPLEQNDLSAREPERLERMVQLLGRERRRAREARIELKELPMIEPPSRSILEELMELGYGGPGDDPDD